MWKDAQQVTDHLREATRIETEELATLKKVIEDYDKELANVDFGTGETKGSGVTPTPTDVKTSPGKAPSFGDRRPDAVEDDSEIQFMKARNVEARKLTNEEMVIYAENIKAIVN